MRKILNKYIIIILSFYAFWILGIPFIFSQTLPRVCENISHNSDYVVEIKKPQLFLYPLPIAKLKAENIEIKHKQEADYTNIKNLKVSVRLLPLLSGTVHINKIKADEIVINSVLKKELELDKDFFSDFRKAKIKCDAVGIKKLAVNINEPNISEPVNYSAEGINYKRTARALKLHLISSLKIKNSVSNANINLYLPQNNNVKKSVVDVKIDNFDTAPLGDYLRQYLPNDLADLRGIINVRVDKQNLTASLENCAIIMKDEAKSIIFPDKLDVKSAFNITNKVINFNNIDVKSKNISASISGYILNYLDKSTTSMNLSVRLDKSRVEDIVDMLPPIIVEEFNVYKLKHYKFFGDVIGNFSIKGDIVEPDINGEVFINNGVLIKPIKNANGATVKLDFTGRYVNFDVNVPAGGAEKVWVKGGVELYNVKYSDMHIWSTKTVDLQTAEEKVVPIHEILNFIIGPVPIMDIKGNGNIDITVKGNRKSPHVWGVLNVNNVTTHFNEISDLVLTKADAVLRFNDQNAEFKTKKGLVNNSPIDISGNCNLYGKFDFDVNSSSQEIGYLYNAIKTSTMIEDVKNMLPKLEAAQGLVNLKLKVYGLIPDINDIQFNKNLFSKGEVELLGNTFSLQGMKIDSTRGKLSFDGMNADADITALLGKSPLAAKANVKNNIADMKISIPKLNLKDVLPLPEGVDNILADVSASYKGKIDNIEFDKVNFAAKVLGASPKSKLKISNGLIALNNNKLKVSKLNGSIINSDSSFNVNLEADNVFEKPRVNGVVQLKSFDLTNLNELSLFMPAELKDIEFKKGKVNLNCKINNNKVNAYSDLGGFTLTYKPLVLPIKIVNGSFMVRNNSLRLNKLNLLADDMPVLLDGVVNDILGKQNFDLYVNSKPKQDFIDKYINKNQLYPVKIKGDIVYTLRAKGVKDNFDVKADVNMAPDSSIYYLGATVGDIENAIVLNLDTKILKQNVLKIKEFSYDKIISSSLGGRQTRLNMLKARGGIEVFKDDLLFHDLYIKTQNPTDARIFNIIFRKPNIKQGQFTSDLRFNGRLSDPKLLGDFHIFETNIPFLDTTMKNITFKFKDKTIDLNSKGEILNNDVAIKAVLKNKLTAPYHVEKAELYTKVLDLNYTIDKMKRSQLDNAQAFDSLEGVALSSIIINNIDLNADNIRLRNIVAKDFKASASLSDKNIMNVKDFRFNIADGTLNGKFNYNFTNSRTALDLKAKEINANDLAYALFDLNNQIYGDLTGDIKLSCTGSSFENCMKTLNGKTVFNVSDGRMPKLGSLEYLLKAGNLLKGGLTSISINGVIDIITPLKTGDFSNIYGVMNIKDGVADDIEIATRGKDLSLFITGKYDFAESEAEMEVLGLLSKKISTMFGPLGNLSLNTLFNAIPGVDLSKNTKLLDKINRIPGIELSSKSFRKFIAEIKGDINGDNYVTSFKWIN